MSLVSNILLVLISCNQLLISVHLAHDHARCDDHDQVRNLIAQCECVEGIPKEEERAKDFVYACVHKTQTEEAKACIRKVYGIESPKSVAEFRSNFCNPPDLVKHAQWAYCDIDIKDQDKEMESSRRLFECLDGAGGSNSAGRPGKPASGGSNRVPSGPEASRSNQLLVSAITTVLIVFIGGIVVGMSH